MLRESLNRNENNYPLQRRFFYLLTSKGKNDEALERAQKICARFPFRRDAHRMLGLAWGFSGDAEKAAASKACKQAIDIARKEYDNAKASAFFHAWHSMS